MKKHHQIAAVVIGVTALIAMLASYYEMHTLYKFTKSLCTILIILFTFQYKISDAYANYILSGLLFCLLGDVFLLWESYFIFGLIAFLIGHILFTLGILKLQPFHWHFKILTILLGIVVIYYAWLYESLAAMAIPVLIYMLVIISMSTSGLSAFFTLKNTKRKWLAWGVGLFMFSDAVLALDKFKMPFDSATFIILSSYWAAVTLLAFSSTVEDNEK